MRRLFPCIQIENGKCVKSRNFERYKYLGDPFNVLRIYNEKEVDELLISITDRDFNLETNRDFLTKLAKQARMPLALSGNISTAEQVEFLVAMGFEKIVLSHCLPFLTINQFSQMAAIAGCQSLVASFPYILKDDQWRFYDWRKRNAGMPIIEIFKILESMKFGEYFFYDVERDGTQTGIDHDFIKFILPMFQKANLSFAGGISSKEEIKELSKRYPGVGFGASTVFSLQGKFHSVLLSYV